MNEWKRPLPGPVPKRQAIADRLRRLEPRTVLIRIVAAVAVVSLIQTGLRWQRATTAIGDTTDVLVVTARVAAGDPVGDGQVTVEARPSSHLPASAVSELAPDAIARTDLGPGEVLTAERVFPDPRGFDQTQRIVTLPLPLAAPPVDAGTTVDLYGILAIGEGLASPARHLTTGVVVEITDTAIAVAIDEVMVPTVVEHLAFGVVDVVALP